MERGKLGCVKVKMKRGENFNVLKNKLLQVEQVDC